MKSSPIFLAEPSNESFEAMASTTGLPLRRCDFTAIVAAVSVMLPASFAAVFDVQGTEVSLAKEDLLIDMAQKDGYVSEADNNMTVVLDTNLTEDLIEEGFAAEVISKIQTMRKDSGFEVMDHILVGITGNDRIAGIVKKNSDSISTKVLADGISDTDVYDISKEWNVNGETVTISVKKN